MDLLRQHEPVLVNRDLVRPAPIPELRIRNLTPDLSVISKRQSSDDSDKQTSGGSDTTPIVIGVVIPVIIIAIILFVILQRRRKITRHEEAHDKYKSLDFGVDLSSAGEKKGRKTKAAPEMSIADIKSTLRKDRGLSLDLGATNPYLLPPEVQQSRESLHSLSRNGDDKYRATTFVPDDGSLRSPSIRSHGDGSSIFSGSTRNRAGTLDTESKTDLLPRIPPKRDGSETPSIRKPLPVAEKPQTGLLAPTLADLDRNSTISTASDNANFAAMRASNNYLGQYIRGGQKQQDSERSKTEQPGLMVSETEVQVTPPASGPQELPAAVINNEPHNTKKQSSYYGAHGVAELASPELPGAQSDPEPTIPKIETTSFEMDATPQSQFPKRSQSKRLPQQLNQEAVIAKHHTPPVPEINVPHEEHRADHSPGLADDASDYYDEEGFDYSDYADYVDYTYRNSTMGVRPLPPDDPTENPEQRANRIRSFYKEYFDDSSAANQARASPANYYDGSEQYDDFDYGYYEQSHSRGQSIRSDMPGPRGRAFTHGSYGSYAPGPRAYSSMSGRGPGPRRPPPKKKLPPPKPLQVLPTPAKLKDDDFMLANVSDFAPPQVFKNQRSGTPDSLRGGLRPYSPSIKPHVPLNSSFDDLAVIPSPHSLRKSGTFTALDFAPPRRFRNEGSEAGSDSGSIRSNRSNLSRMHLQNIRNGAYRVSRIPADVAGTRDDMYSALKPKWNMRGDGAGNDGLGMVR